MVRRYDLFTQDIEYAKIKYANKTGEPVRPKFNIDFAWLTWDLRFTTNIDLIDLFAGWSTLFRFLLDLHLNLDLHLDASEFDWHTIDLHNFFTPSYETISKAYYGVSKYGRSYYDPPRITIKNMERMAWQLSKHVTHHTEWRYKQKGKTLQDYMQVIKDMIVDVGVRDFFIDALKTTLAVAEAKILHSAYWGASIWDSATWVEETEKPHEIPVRDTEDFTTHVSCETDTIHENWWDISRWDYAYWHSVEPHNWEEIEEYLDKAIKDFHQRNTPQYQAPFMAERGHKITVHGGFEVIRKTYLMKRVSRILDDLGILPIQKPHYIAFIQELKYRNNKGFKKEKQWREMLTKEDIIKKYVKLGLDENILRNLSILVS